MGSGCDEGRLVSTGFWRRSRIGTAKGDLQAPGCQFESLTQNAGNAWDSSCFQVVKLHVFKESRRKCLVAREAVPSLEPGTTCSFETGLGNSVFFFCKPCSGSYEGFSTLSRVLGQDRIGAAIKVYMMLHENS